MFGEKAKHKAIFSNANPDVLNESLMGKEFGRHMRKLISVLASVDSISDVNHCNIFEPEIVRPFTRINVYWARSAFARV